MYRSIFILLTLIPFYCAAANVTVIGIGKLGLSLALNLERAGHRVLGVDVNEKYVEMVNEKRLQSKEPGISDALNASTHFRATTSLEEGLAFSDVYFVLVSTTFQSQSYNFSILDKLLEEMNGFHLKDKHLVICSTVIPGYINNRARYLLQDCEKIEISYNAPFVAQGTIMQNLTHPDMVLIGADSEKGEEFLETTYRKICQNSPYFARMSVESAEITKLALNCAVTSKIAMANLIGDIADLSQGADKHAILKAVGSDTRVGKKYFSAGYAYGGPCFTRDNRLLAEYCESVGVEPLLFKGTDQSNQKHTIFMGKNLVKKGLDEYRFKDVSYKPNCPVKIIEFSQKLAVAEYVAKHEKRVVIIDTEETINLIKQEYGDLFEYEVCEY